MNPEIDDAVLTPQAACSPTRPPATSSDRVAAGASLMRSTASSIRKSQVFQRRLKEKISESRALELLDRRIKGDRVIVADETAMGDSNQDQDDELVCDSTMVRFEATPEEHAEPRACGVLKTVRGIHRQRERDGQPVTRASALHRGAPENQ